MTKLVPRLMACGDAALTVDFGNVISVEVNRRVHALDAALLALLQQNPAPSPGTARLLRGLVSSDELAGDDAESVWLRVVAGWFGQA